MAKVGDILKIKDKVFEIIDFADEPNTGLLVVSCYGHSYNCAIPIEIWDQASKTLPEEQKNEARTFAHSRRYRAEDKHFSRYRFR